MTQSLYSARRALQDDGQLDLPTASVRMDQVRKYRDVHDFR